MERHGPWFDRERFGEANLGAAQSSNPPYDPETIEPDADPLDTDVRVAETLVRVARECDAQAVVVGAHGHGSVESVLLGSITCDVIRHAPCPVVVVRDADH